MLPQLLLTGVATGLDSTRESTSRSILVLVQKVPEASRGISGWLLELLSMTLYSRPALCLLQSRPIDESRVPVSLVMFVDWLHLLLLLVVTAAAMVAVFRKRERRWLEMV